MQATFSSLLGGRQRRRLLVALVIAGSLAAALSAVTLDPNRGGQHVIAPRASASTLPVATGAGHANPNTPASNDTSVYDPGTDGWTGSYPFDPTMTVYDPGTGTGPSSYYPTDPTLSTYDPYTGGANPYAGAGVYDPGTDGWTGTDPYTGTADPSTGSVYDPGTDTSAG